ncbi:hypothetical protein [Hallella colorans]|uniref:hypothetical protein n=1 Tax=Hallella colorans TaxID=1703337 RepID=UPI001A9C5585|nr:hypothetical protein [Hallella colorans]
MPCQHISPCHIILLQISAHHANPRYLQAIEQVSDMPRYGADTPAIECRNG